MESYPVDIDPSQVVRWIKAEHERSPSAFRITARRSRQVRDIPVRQELHLGDEEREDLNEIATIGTLEIAPGQAADGWLIRIVVEDEAGPRISTGETASAAEQQLDLGAFYHEFIRSGRGSADITAETDGPESRTRLADLLRTIERNGPHTDIPERFDEAAARGSPGTHDQEGETTQSARLPMLKELNRDQAQFVAMLAKAARMQRDAAITEIREADLTEPKRARGEHNPMADVGFVALPKDASQLTMLREAVDSLTPAGRSELFALMRMGRGELSAKQWHRGLTEAVTLGDDTVTAAVVEDPDLHDHLMKGLYEAKLTA